MVKFLILYLCAFLAGSDGTVEHMLRASASPSLRCLPACPYSGCFSKMPKPGEAGTTDVCSLTLLRTEVHSQGVGSIGSSCSVPVSGIWCVLGERWRFLAPRCITVTSAFNITWWSLPECVCVPGSPLTRMPSYRLKAHPTPG